MKLFRTVSPWALAIAVLAVTISPVSAQWSSWRGPHQSGVSYDTGLIDAWRLNPMM